jgi:hypothetical protein
MAGGRLQVAVASFVLGFVVAATAVSLVGGAALGRQGEEARVGEWSLSLSRTQPLAMASALSPSPNFSRAVALAGSTRSAASPTR